ncbi:zinc protease PQQL-like [Argentina anserina]|uniref:zinc protease PQQL-like n=1 Tax=Argentina anserina TaxID=57926 RepID=UPI002176364B|nr:zinc protease PQQL-like [Potentilla anserina]
MVEEQCSVQLCFPVELNNGTMVEDIHVVGFLSKLLETKITQVLRFKHKQIYTGCFSILGGNKPPGTANVRGDISINFSWDPEISSKLRRGLKLRMVDTILESEQRTHENGIQENYYWLERILHSYQSRIYSGDVGTCFEPQEEGRLKVRQSLTPGTAQLALRNILPYP